MNRNSEITWGDCSGSQYLKQDDIPQAGVIVTIEAFERRVIEGRNGEPDKPKVCVEFEEYDKLLVLNSTNGDAIRIHTNTERPDQAIGKQIELYVDPNVAFGGKIVGGIRIRAIADIPYESA